MCTASKVWIGLRLWSECEAMEANGRRGPIRREEKATLSGGVLGVAPPRRVGITETPPDPFGDIAAPPLRVAPAARARDASRRSDDERSETEAGGQAPKSATTEVIVLMNPLAAAPAPSDAGRSAAAGADSGAGIDAVPTFDAAARSGMSNGPRAAGFPASSPAAASAVDAPDAHSSGRRQLRIGVLVGLILAAGIVVLAIMFRPTPAKTAAIPAPAAVLTLEGSSVEGSAGGQDAGATATSATDVLLRTGPVFGSARLDQLRTAVLGAGYRSVALHPMPFATGRPRIEYFHADDRAAAETLRRVLEPLAGPPLDLRARTGAEVGMRIGRIDVWFGE